MLNGIANSCVPEIKCINPFNQENAMTVDKDLKDSKQRTGYRAGRKHQGNVHWHVEHRSTVIICGECKARIPRNAKPLFCPECGEGKH